MKFTKSYIAILIFLSSTIISIQCRTGNHIDTYKVSIDSLLTLPTGFYAYRGGRVYVEDVHVTEYRVWFDLDEDGNISNVFKLENFKIEKGSDTIVPFPKDTSEAKVLAQTFVNLSNRFKFGHLLVDKKSRISFSSNPDIPEGYVYTFNDSLRTIYLTAKGFKKSSNGWLRNMK